MSLFFRNNPTTEANFSVQATTGVVSESTLLVSLDIWDALGFSGESRKIVCVKPKRHGLSSSLTCWAIPDSTVSEIAIPPAWLDTYPAIFRPFQANEDEFFKPIILSTVESIALSEVVLAAKHEEAYLAATVHGAVFENWFFESCFIIRDGEDIFIPTSVLSTGGPSIQPPSFFGYTVNLVLPYRQGIARRGSTRFVITSCNRAVSDEVDSPISHENMEISEAFLMSSILTPPESLSQANEVRHSDAAFSAEPLQSPIDVDLDQFTVYICARNLRPLGVFNGSWVIVSSINDATTSRLLRIGILDGTFDDSCRRLAMLSPTLLHNLCPRGHRQIVVRLSPHASCDPGIPTAKSLTLARVASPFSIRRCYEHLFLDALHEYFGSSKRLVKAGDLIPLRINIDRSLDPHHILSLGDFTGGVMSHCSDVLVYFVVRNLDYDAPTLQSLPNTDAGCIVDAHVTKIIQAGVENVGVPDLDDYYQLRHVQMAFPDTSGISAQISRLSNTVALGKTSGVSVRNRILVTGSRGMGKFSVAVGVAHLLQMHLVEINCFDVLSDTIAKTVVLLQEAVEIALSCSPCLAVLRHVDALNHLVDIGDGKDGSFIFQMLQQSVDDISKTHGQQCVLLGIMGKDKMQESIPFSNEIQIKALSEKERSYMLLEQMNTQHGHLACDVSISALAKQTAALTASDLADLMRQTCLASVLSSNIHQLVTKPVMSTKQFESALLKARKAFSQNIGIPSIPAVMWEDIGGLNLVKDEILDTVQLPLDHPELFQDGVKKRSGVLLYGPPGTGKTLLAKAVATSCSLNFFSVKGPELLNMYIGESEANVRHIFERARDARPCVIFFDELDSIAPKRGNQGDSGGVMDRIVSQLLAELDGMAAGCMDIFVIGATNRPDLLDPALLRPGRFDRMLYLGVCETHEDQFEILKALTRKFNLDHSLNLFSIAELCPFNYTGADFYALCADALLHALSFKVAELEKERDSLNTNSEHLQQPISAQFFISEMKSDVELQLVVGVEDFCFALKELDPSISYSELAHYASIRKNWHN